jgi:hypothetical protein
VQGSRVAPDATEETLGLHRQARFDVPVAADDQDAQVAELARDEL